MEDKLHTACRETGCKAQCQGVELRGRVEREVDFRLILGGEEFPRPADTHTLTRNYLFSCPATRPP